MLNSSLSLLHHAMYNARHRPLDQQNPTGIDVHHGICTSSGSGTSASAAFRFARLMRKTRDFFIACPYSHNWIDSTLGPCLLLFLSNSAHSDVRHLHPQSEKMIVVDTSRQVPSEDGGHPKFLGRSVRLGIVFVQD